MELITKSLYWISTGLLIPVIILLLLFFVRALMLIGTFYAMYIQKLKFNKEATEIFDNMNKDNVEDSFKKIGVRAKLPFTLYLDKLYHTERTEAHLEKVLNNYEIFILKDISSSQSLAKLGPILGLMGTLIPMGPALVGLASGDIASMATNMQVAFATTVIGLFIGAVGFIVMQVKRRWFAQDMSNLEFAAELLNPSDKGGCNCGGHDHDEQKNVMDLDYKKAE